MKFHVIIAWFVGILVLALGVLGLFFQKIEPGQIGVKQNQWGGGVIAEDYAPGYHLGIWGVHKWHILDQRTHFLTFTHPSGHSPSSKQHTNSQDRNTLAIRTTDNNTVDLDVTVTYRILPGKAHQIVLDGRQADYHDRVASKVRGVLREELAKLTPVDLYTTDTRLARAAETLPVLAKNLEEYNVVPEKILIRAVRFLESYEAELQGKQLTQQRAKLEESKRLVEDALKITGTIEKETEALEKELIAEWNKRLQDVRSDNEVAIASITAAANIYDKRVRAVAGAEYEKLLAEGKLALAQAEALRDGLRNAALDTEGGRILQARDAAENLNIESVTLNSNDPAIPSVIEIDELVRILVGGAPPTEDN